MTTAESADQAPDRLPAPKPMGRGDRVDDAPERYPRDSLDTALDVGGDGFALFEADGPDDTGRLRLVDANRAARAAFDLEPGEQFGPCLAPRPSARIWSMLWDAILDRPAAHPRLGHLDLEPAEALPGAWDVVVVPAGPGRAVVTWRDGGTDGATDSTDGGRGASSGRRDRATDRREAAPQERHPAERPGRDGERAVTHDVLTGLPNGALFRGRLTDALGECRPGQRLAVVFCTLNGLAEAADARYGPPVSRGLLQATADRLTRQVRSGDVVARIGADTFALVLRWPAPGADPVALLDRLTRLLRRPLAVQSTILAPSPSLGLVLVDPVGGPAADRDPDNVLLRSFEAMQRSKIAGEPVVAADDAARAERERVAALRSYRVQDGSFDEVFRSAAKLAAAVCGTASAVVSFIDDDLQWIRVTVGLEPEVAAGERGPRHLALCNTTIRGRKVLVMSDLRGDPRCSSKHVRWQRDMVFYAGAPLIDLEGHVIGTLCVMDTVPGDLSGRQRHSLANLADEIMGVIESRRSWRS